MIVGWLYCWTARWWMKPRKHRNLVAGVLRRLRQLHIRLPFGYRTAMRVHRRTFTSTLR